MRVLWIASGKGLFSAQSENSYNGGGWVAGLQTAMSQYGNGITLGLTFLTKEKLPFRVDKRGVAYFPIYFKKTPINKILDRIKRKTDKPFLATYKAILADFHPDIIHVFGVEMPYSYMIGETNIPTIVHLQGFLNPYTNAFFPPGIGVESLLKHPYGLKLYHAYNSFKRNSLKERHALTVSKNVMGRTLWDRQIADLMTNGAKYFHIDEILRPCFYTSKKWQYQFNGIIKIATTISPAMYKGLDLILKTATLLRDLNIKFEWKIIGINGNSQMVKLFRSQYRTGTEITSISFLGRMEAENIVEVLLHSDLYVHPSYIDNSPNSLCEAQILGVPVIACNVGGVSSLVENGVTGLLIPANGVYELASIIKNYKSYPMNKFSANEISHAETRHNMKRVVQSLIDSYKECTK